MGDICFLPLCRGVFIPPRPFLGPRHRNGEGSAGIRCAAGRPSWHRLSGRPVLCQHAFGRSVAAARAAAGAGAALAGAPAGRAAKSVESGTRCICGRRIPFTGHSLVCPVRFVCADGQRKKCAPCRCGRDRADAGCDVEYRELPIPLRWDSLRRTSAFPWCVFPIIISRSLCSVRFLL